MGLYFGRSRIYEALLILLSLCGLYWFAASFFLAKRSISNSSTCDEAEALLHDQLHLTPAEIREHILPLSSDKSGCWMNRNVDSIIILLVDALRFDFAYYNLPHSVGRRLSSANHPHSKLYQFLADPPTVTMQRIKALTTGSLPTFADISGNFGGADVSEDTWMRQLIQSKQSIGFVGDDTWVDLFSADTYFSEAYPYPSFNTRDLDTVDKGCQKHLPDLLPKIRRTQGQKDGASTHDGAALDVLVVHFLGVDHVGHTYGPHNEHMDAKLREMDATLTAVLETVDDPTEDGSCHSVLIFGDHGMTEDGNHGGGTTEETHAALFVHTSPGCNTSFHSPDALEQQAVSVWVKDTLFASIHQIDLVPTISFLLGLPIPYSNLGGVVPSILPGTDVREMALALALNAAQVWRYYDEYSRTANRLPDLDRLREQLEIAVAAYREALQSEHGSAHQDKYYDCAALFKAFLTEALELGQRVWTRFDTVGMVAGFCVLAISALCFAQPLLFTAAMQHQRTASAWWELSISVLFVVYHCGLKSFSNSYILEEENSSMYCLTILSLLVAFRVKASTNAGTLWRGVLLIPVASRIGELFVTGHGLDPALQLHSVHHPVFFLGSLSLLGSFRWFLFRNGLSSTTHAIVDCSAMLLLGLSWWEKRSMDPERNGYWLCRAVLLLVFTGLPISMFQSARRKATELRFVSGDVLAILCKLLVGIMAVTGPSTAPSVLIYVFQITIVVLVATCGDQLRPLVVCALLRLITRHAFFATNHGCAFNRLQYSAAFVSTNDFVYEIGGISLFLNTFGWEVAGILVAWNVGRQSANPRIWKLYGCLQLLEASASCISVAVLRRHLMVWDIYAPHFLFAAIFTVLHMVSHLLVLPFSTSA